MISKSILFALFLFSLISFGCGGTAPANTADTANGANNSLDTKPPATDELVNNAPTLTPVFKTYCDAWVKNDEAAIRKVYSKDTIKYFEQMMKEDKISGLMKFLEDDKVSGKLCEVRNETITGETAVAEIRSDIYPQGIKIVFVKEGDDWKMTNKSPDSITQTKAEPAGNPPAGNNADAKTDK